MPYRPRSDYAATSGQWEPEDNRAEGHLGSVGLSHRSNTWPAGSISARTSF
jgi:hypothetical protein